VNSNGLNADEGACEETAIWRYMDLPRFVAMLAHRTLWFTKARLFDDPYEGFCQVEYSKILPPEAGPEWVTQEDGQGRTMMSVPRMLAGMSQRSATYFQNTREHLYVNSWCLADESMAMWEIYGSAGRGVAIQSSVERYKRAAKFTGIRPQQYAFDAVKYHGDLASCPELQLDLKSSIPMPGAGIWSKLLQLGFHKRVCFEHEKEWRAALYQDHREDDGCNIDFDMDELISAVFVGPRAASFLLDVVWSIMNRFQFDKPLDKSALLCSPFIKTIESS